MAWAPDVGGSQMYLPGEGPVTGQVAPLGKMGELRSRRGMLLGLPDIGNGETNVEKRAAGSGKGLRASSN